MSYFDNWEEAFFNDDEDEFEGLFRDIRNTNLPECFSCGETCYWEETVDGYKLYDFETEELHECPHRKVATIDEFENDE